MPPKRRPMISRSRGNDPTVNIANAATARFAQEEGNEEEMPQTIENKEQKANDDLKKLIETLKNKMSNNSTQEKKAPPSPKARTPWNRSVTGKDENWSPKPAYTVLTRISNHEKVTQAKGNKSDVTINEVPHAFLYRPGADGIKVDKLNIKSGKQIGMA